MIGESGERINQKERFTGGIVRKNGIKVLTTPYLALQYTQNIYIKIFN